MRIDTDLIMSGRAIAIDEDTTLDRGKTEMCSSDRGAALGLLLEWLENQNYSFVTPTPLTHECNLARFGELAADLRDVFGWSRQFDRRLLPERIFSALWAAGWIACVDENFKSLVRASTVHGLLFCHSAFPTDAADAVFLGPDSYRFADLIQRERRALLSNQRILDFGAGAGVGGLTGIRGLDAELVLADVNPTALMLARVNANHVGVTPQFVYTKAIEDVPGAFDLILMNPPFLADSGARTYRDGGGLHGAGLSLEWAESACQKLAPGGRAILYTGSAIIAGEDRLYASLTARLESSNFELRYAEIDPDVFSEELQTENYHDVERIAVVAAIIDRKK